jgi:hypothetical protein
MKPEKIAQLLSQGIAEIDAETLANDRGIKPKFRTLDTLYIAAYCPQSPHRDFTFRNANQRMGCLASSQ